MPWVYHMGMVVASEMFRPGQDLDSFYVQTATRSNTSQNLCPLSALILTLPFKVTLDVQDFTVETSSDWLHTQASISHNTTHLTRFFFCSTFLPSSYIYQSIHYGCSILHQVNNIPVLKSPFVPLILLLPSNPSSPNSLLLYIVSQCEFRVASIVG